MTVTADREDSRPQVHERLRGLVGADGPRIHVTRLGLVDALSRPTPVPPDAVPGTALVPVHLHDDKAVVGPYATVLDGGRWTRPCPNCLARRWQAIRSTDERDVLEYGAPLRAVGESPFLHGFGLDRVARVACALAAERPTDFAGHPYVYEVDLGSAQTRRFPLLADSGCPLCADRPADDPERTVADLRSRPKRTPDSFRRKAPDAYGLSVDAYVNPVCGALGPQVRHRFECTTTAPAIGHMAVRGQGYMHDSFWGGHAYNFDESVLLGVLEGLERHAGMRPRSVTTAVVDSYENVRDDAVDPLECGVYADGFYDGNDYFVRYTPQLKIPWVWGRSLRDDRPVLVPEIVTYYHVHDPVNKYLQECSNGCATGSCMEEAILYGLLELIERDAYVLSWYGRARLPEIATDSLTDTRSRMLVDRIALGGYDVRLFDTRIEFPVPVVTAVGVRRDGGMGTLCVGAGTSLDPEAAVKSALGEIANTIPGFDVHSAADADRLRALAADYSRVETLADHPSLFGLPEMARHVDFLLDDPDPRPMAEVYRDWSDRRPYHLDLLDDLRYLAGTVTGAGFDVIVVDHTSPEQRDAGVRGAGVIVPGLLPIDFGWGRQRALHMPRMRTAFRRAGLRTTELDDSELHLVPHPFP
ncbi:ribosomal protein S12 methylthiotransferase accessory factor [Actinomadura pelletieri DSM 43383]|uniref:Ribosomal protein S12 methylthiotransferase accessory factor n=1 Tax=Actinomadura pelletieri DSM 43383 TaxID=1120940 RepID=A0A495QGM2_9ACTN|nr:TOMM precursor leader peptide-binding protein [Actinomadura pelletieri]RKS70999.1 ribosomal protein S12 methylthiotransferase accessory factor [Actinomadura pelletieri DSM 43383]